MILYFYHDEDGYSEWLRSNPNGYVFNHFGSSDGKMNVIHHAHCHTLSRSSDIGVRTRIEKICSTEIEELLNVVYYVRGDSWKYCGACCSTMSRQVRIQSQVESPFPVTVTLDKQLIDLIDDISCNRLEIFISGKPAVWVGSGEVVWKQTIQKVIQQDRPLTAPQYIDLDIFLEPDELLSKDLDNLITPVLDALRNASLFERGFPNLTSLTATKRSIALEDKVQGVNISIWHEPIRQEFDLGDQIVIISHGFQSSEKGIKAALYTASASWWEKHQHEQIGEYPIYLKLNIYMKHPRSIRDLLKPCIDGLEPILGRTDNKPPVFGLKRMFHKYAPQDHSIMALAVNVRKANQDKIEAILHKGPASFGIVQNIVQLIK